MKLLKKNIKSDEQKTRKLRFWFRFFSPFFIGFFLYAAYRWPGDLGWMVLLLWPFLFYYAFEWFSRFDFFVCMMIFCSFHFWWVFLFLQKYGKGSFSLHFFLYGIIVCLYVSFFLSFFYIVLFLLKKHRCRIMRFVGVLILSGSFFCIERWGGSFGGQALGYPLLHPVLPLLSFCQFQFKNKEGCCLVVSLCPASLTVGSLYHALEGALSLPLTNAQKRVFVTPELAVEEDLGFRHDKMVHLIDLLSEQDFLCVGALKNDHNKIRHAVYVYNYQGLVACLEKEFLVPFYEYIPSCFKKYQWAEDLFLQNKNAFVEGERCENDLPFDCFVCADFFLKPLKRSNKSNIFFVLMNDKCLPKYIVDLLLNYAEWKCFKEGATGFCVGWNNSLKIF